MVAMTFGGRGQGGGRGRGRGGGRGQQRSDETAPAAARAPKHMKSGEICPASTILMQTGNLRTQTEPASGSMTSRRTLILATSEAKSRPRGKGKAKDEAKELSDMEEDTEQPNPLKKAP